MKLCLIKLKGNEYEVTDYYKNLPTSPCDKYVYAKEQCRLRLEKTIYEELNEFKVPFIGLWLVW
jgi:hypothetical protein